MAAPGPVDYATMPILSMNMAGRFTGKEIKTFGQQVIRHILNEKQVGLFMGQQINFKPSLPEGYEYVGSNKAFMCYNKHLLKVNDERQYRHFLRDLHVRGQLPHHYLPEKNYVVLKMRFKNKPWSEFIAMSWLTEERQTKVKNIAHMRKVMYYITHLAEAEEMPVVLGGSFRIPWEDMQPEMDGSFTCYGYTPATARRSMRMCSLFLSSEPMKIDTVKPLICAKMNFETDHSVRWLNPEDAFYFDPVICDLMFPIETPENLEQAKKFENKVSNHIKDKSSKQKASSQTRPITGISSKHLLVSASTPLAGQPSGLQLPTAPVLPTPQENLAPPPSPEEECQVLPDVLDMTNNACHLPAIDEVSSEIERQDGLASSESSHAGSPYGPGPANITHDISTAESEKEEMMFELLESMMNDKASTFYVQNGKDSTDNPEVDPAIMRMVQHKQLSSLEELRITLSKDSPTNSPSIPTAIDNGHSIDPQDKQGSGGASTLDRCQRTFSVPELRENKHKFLSEGSQKMKRSVSYQELYDDDLIENSTTCYMS